jgi:hypothetical protein
MGNENFVPNPPAGVYVDWKNTANKIWLLHLFLLTGVFE